MQTEEKKDESEAVVVTTDQNAKVGQDKCPKCGSTDIALNEATGKLRCNFCRYEFEPKKVEGMVTDLTSLKGEVLGAGVKDIQTDTNDVITLKCESCGAEVVIDTASSSQARCHWCRNVLSINQQIPNGSIPDVVLPFHITKEEANQEIKKFVQKRQFFAHPTFKKEFNLDNIMGVYFPYMIVDVNAHAHLAGQGEHLLRSYEEKEGDHYVTYYDAELYNVERDFDIVIDGLTIESKSDQLNSALFTDKTNNVINSIMPFDVENCVPYNSNYLKGYTSERRDTNVDEIKPYLDDQSKDIARFQANASLKKYDRGVAWRDEQLDVNGQQWKAAYLPVWLYSYQQVSGDKKILHYVAVNARTKETMGSVPIHMPKLIIMSILFELIGIFLMQRIRISINGIFLLTGVVYFLIMYLRYRNINARHAYEKETKAAIRNLKTKDDLVKVERGLSSPTMRGANNYRVQGQGLGNEILSTLNQFNQSGPDDDNSIIK